MPAKICVLIWKDLLLRRNRFILSALEVLIVLAFMIFINLKLSHLTDLKGHKEKMIFEPKIGSCSNIPNQSKIIIYEPSNSFLENLMKDVACKAGFNVKPGIIRKNETFFIGVEFHGMDEKQSNPPASLNYTIYPRDPVWKNAHELWDYSDVEKMTKNSLKMQIYRRLQYTVDYSFLLLKGIPVMKFEAQSFALLKINKQIFLLLVMSMYGISNSVVISTIIQEKISGIKGILLLMGAKRWQMWLAKFIDALIPLTIIVVTTILLLYFPLEEKRGIFYYVHPREIITVFTFGTISILVFIFFLSCFFNNVLAAIFIVSVLWLIAFTIQEMIKSLDTSWYFYFIICLIPQICLVQTFSLLLDFEVNQKIARYQERLSRHSKAMTLLEYLLMMLLDTILYSFLLWYLDRVLPGKFGVPRPFYFCFTKSYWTRGVNLKRKKISQDDCFNQEKISKESNVGVTLNEVSKSYKLFRKGTVLAVDNVNIHFHRGEITGLLGHNGAGKTTLLSLICGLTPLTSGTILINDYDLKENTREARKNIAFCPQQDILYVNLSALNNIAFFGMIKGLSRQQAFQEGNDLLERLKMYEVRGKIVRKLSGGQKRKVSLASALIGNNEILILDEPTSGIDLKTCKEVWDILLQLRGSKTVILTTHSTEEANAVCDRIAVMVDGQIKYFASPKHLKFIFRAGYTLLVMVADLGRVNQITSLVQRHIKTASFKSQFSLKLFYQLPEKEIQKFPELFKALDEKRAAGIICTYSISSSALDDAFLMMHQNASMNEEHEYATNHCNHQFTMCGGEIESEFYETSHSCGHNCEDTFNMPKKSTGTLIFIQFYALLVKKFLFLKKKIILFCSFVIFIIALIIIEVYSVKKSKERGNEFIFFTSSLYKDFEIMFSTDSDNDLVNSFKKYVDEEKFATKRVENVPQEVKNLFERNYYKLSRFIVAIGFSTEKISLHYNGDAIHALPIALNLMSNTFLKTKENSTITTSTNIKFIDNDSNLSLMESLEKCPLVQKTIWPTFLAVLYLLGPMQEQFYGVKHLQLMLVPVMVYWLNHLIFDLITFWMINLLIVGVLALTEKEISNFISKEAGMLAPSLILWSISLLLFYYAVTTKMKTVGSAVIFSFIFFSVTFVLSIVSEVLDKVSFLKYFSYLHPTTLLNHHIEYICNNSKGSKLLYQGIYLAVLFLYLLLHDSKILGKIIHKVTVSFFGVHYCMEQEKHYSTQVEEERVKNLILRNELTSQALVVDELKRYHIHNCKADAAIQGVSFTVNHGECFGLLGANGAGKTSIFRVLTGENSPSEGRAYVNGLSLLSYFNKKALFQIGYCSQFNGFFPNFNCSENLKLFARLRGVRAFFVKEEIRKWITKMNLEGHKNKSATILSGGNQRKLATAIALIADAPLIFLDEPTTGVDPVGRRSILNLISNVNEEGRSVVLTSHSMEECEAICSRLTIMMNGQLCWIGETAVLKETFGRGYSVLFKFRYNTSAEEREILKRKIMVLFHPDCCMITDEYLTMLQCHITNTVTTWKNLFDRLIKLKTKLRFIESYSASATTLDQMFMFCEL